MSLCLSSTKESGTFLHSIIRDIYFTFMLMVMVDSHSYCLQLWVIKWEGGINFLVIMKSVLIGVSLGYTVGSRHRSRDCSMTHYLSLSFTLGCYSVS